jgi:hypothetical protein
MAPTMRNGSAPRCGASGGQPYSFQYWPNFDSALAGAWNAGCEGDGVVQIFTATRKQSLARFREGNVGDQPFAAAHLDAGAARARSGG